MTKIKQILENQLDLMASRFVRYSAVVPRDTKLEDVLKPEYWAHVHNRFIGDDKKPLIGSEIVVYLEDFSMRFDLVVTDVKEKAVVVRKLNHYSLCSDFPMSDKATDYARKLFIAKGEKAGFRIIRNSDNEILEEGVSREDLPTVMAKYNGE